jgi:hypothetical protein
MTGRLLDRPFAGDWARERGCHARKSIHLALGCTFLLIGCGSDGVDDDASTSASTTSMAQTTYASTAQTTYTHYQSAAAGRVQFVVTPLDRGKLTDIADRPVNDLVGIPDHWVRMQQRGTDIVDVVRELRNPALDEWSQAIDLHRFDQIGHPLAEGTYQLLSVRMTLDGEVSEHKALEACWAVQDYCIVMDPVVQQLSSFAESRRDLLAAGWKVSIVPAGEVFTNTGDHAALTSVCSLNSHPTWGGITYTWSAWTATYKDIFGITLVSKYLAGQQTGISCYVSSGACRSSGNGYSFASSCSATLGYNCSCDNSGTASGSTQPATRAWSETKCTHAFAGNTSISFSWQGVGSSLSLVWNTNGSVDSNGGQAYDACSYH